jgi:hypothetical protein
VVPASIVSLRESTARFLAATHNTRELFLTTVGAAYHGAMEDAAVSAVVAHVFHMDLDNPVRVADRNAFLDEVRGMEQQYNLILARKASQGDVTIDVLFENSSQKLVAVYKKSLGSVPLLTVTIPAGLSFKIHPSSMGRPPYTALAHEIYFILLNAESSTRAMIFDLRPLFEVSATFRGLHATLRQLKRATISVKTVQERNKDHTKKMESMTNVVKGIFKEVRSIAKQTKSTSTDEFHRREAARRLNALDVFVCKTMTALLMKTRGTPVSVPMSVMRFRVWSLES